jgi:methylated-DNA-[protein]-cysteine S-methyltransferase
MTTTDVAFTRYDAPIGPLLLAAGPAGLVRVAFLDVDDEERVRDEVAAARRSSLGVGGVLDGGTVGGGAVDGGAAGKGVTLDEERRAFDAYFAGRTPDVRSRVDLAVVTGFRREVLAALQEVPAGTTVSYSALAAAAGRPRAVRAAASACATNPVPVVVPCHRVVRSDGSLGGYLGGLEAKRALLALESTAVTRQQSRASA